MILPPQQKYASSQYFSPDLDIVFLLPHFWKYFEMLNILLESIDIIYKLLFVSFKCSIISLYSRVVKHLFNK